MISEVYTWLNFLDKCKQNSVPMYVNEFRLLNKICPLNVQRVIKNDDGEPRLFFIDKKETIDMLKQLYGFHTKDEATKQLKEHV